MKLINHHDVMMELSEEDMFQMWRMYYPIGSGPLSTMRIVCALIETVAILRGFDVKQWENKN